MCPMKRLARIVIPTMAGVLLLASSGCGGNSPTMDPAVAEQRKQARVSAFGPSGQENARGAGGGGGNPSSGGGSQASARAKAQGGR